MATHTPPIDWKDALRQRELLLAVGVLALIALFFIPLPPVILDLLFAMNITVGMLILLNVLFVDKALNFTSFPMLLLVTTTFRLALNVASTRLIIRDGHSTTAAAGKIIETFGEVIMGNNFIIGIVIFLILIIVNFMVITKGSGRIAEVAARFTLDSLPGKQMAIDADLNAGLIDEDIARTRRKELEQETSFYGAMDGASKFVRGDAIAGLMITGLNIIVGIVVGTTQHDMSMMEAANRYFLLTIGDGLVAYIPALTISIAAGMLVAKSGTSGGAGEVVFEQLSQNERPLFIGAGMMVLISFVPGMPMMPFWFLAASLATFGYYARQNQAAAIEAEQEAEKEEAIEEAQELENQEEPIASILHIDTLRLELGYGLLGLIDESRGGRLTDQIKAMRRQMAKDIGFVVPSIRIQDNMQLQPGEYNLAIKDIDAGKGNIEPGKLLAMDPTGTAVKIEGIETVEPTFGLPALWIDEGKKEDATFNGYTVVDNATVIVTHLTEVIKDNLPELLTRQELDKLMSELEGEHGKLISEIIPDRVTPGLLQKILQNLLAERVSIRDLPTILEALSDHPGSMRDVAPLTEIVRQRLSRQISRQHEGMDGTIPLVAISPSWEKEFTDSLLVEGNDRQLAMAPDKVQNFLTSSKDIIEKQLMQGIQPVILTSPSIRPFVRKLTERTMPSIAIMSQAELSPKAKIKTVGSI